MRYIIFIILIWAIRVSGQNNLDPLTNLEKETEESFQRLGVNYHDAICDSIMIDSKNYFFQKSPITHFKGYTRVFTTQEVIIPIVPFLPGSKGYSITWII
jgi:hypothetical protein